MNSTVAQAGLWGAGVGPVGLVAALGVAKIVNPTLMERNPVKYPPLTQLVDGLPRLSSGAAVQMKHELAKARRQPAPYATARGEWPERYQLAKAAHDEVRPVVDLARDARLGTLLQHWSPGGALALTAVGLGIASYGALSPNPGRPAGPGAADAGSALMGAGALVTGGGAIATAGLLRSARAAKHSPTFPQLKAAVQATYDQKQRYAAARPMVRAMIVGDHARSQAREITSDEFELRRHQAMDGLNALDTRLHPVPEVEALRGVPELSLLKRKQAAVAFGVACIGLELIAGGGLKTLFSGSHGNKGS